MKAFALTSDTAAEWGRFATEAAKWKPDGYDAEMALRLRYYLNQQVDDTRSALRDRFPETWDKMVPVTLPVTKHLIGEKAKVFLATTKLDLVRDGEPLEAEAQDGEEAGPDPLLAWWEKTKKRMGLALRLKRVDAYTQLMRTCFLRIGHVPGRFTAQVVFPHRVRLVLDPAAPMDLDRAHGVAIEIASEAGLAGGSSRWEFWCAREGEVQHLIIEEGTDADGKLTAKVIENEEGDPLLAPDGRVVVPLVAFAAHTEELGLFTMEGSDLVPMNRGLNVLVSDIFHIAEQQGFGVMVVTTQAGGKAPGKIVRSPNTAISLEAGVDAKFINASAPFADLVALVKTRLQMAATLDGIPPGAVALDARAVASGIQLQIEMRPLTEARQDQVEVYQEPIRRVWDVLWATYNAFAGEANAPVAALDPDLELQWTPGDMAVPTDPQVQIDNVIAKLSKKLCTRAEAIAELRGVSVEEGRQIAARIDEEDGPAAPVEPVDDPLGIKAKREAMMGRAPMPPEPAVPAE